MTSSVSISDYINQFHQLKRERETDRSPTVIKVALLSSFTTKGFEETLTVIAHQSRIVIETYVADYNQYTQEILDQNSELYLFQPDIVFLFIDTRSLLADDYFLPYQSSDEQRSRWTSDKLAELTSLIKTLTSHLTTKVVIHNFEVPTYSPLGLVESKRTFGLIESIQVLNHQLRDVYKNNYQVFVFDYEGWCSSIGKQRLFDPKMYYLGDIKVNFKFVPQLGEAYLGYLKPLAALTKKCLVLDLDNTLWGGVIGEEGMAGIKLGPTPHGRPFWEFQKHLLALFNRGVILAINSKNNLDDVMQVFKEHPYMVLKENHFAAMQVNWNDKASNMRALAKEIDIGLDSLVFLDDDALNRELIRQELPEVTVIEMPPDPAHYVSTLTELTDFYTLRLTDEDLKKGEMYAQQRKRNICAATLTDIDDFLRELKMVVTLAAANEFTIPRIAQLTQKTNQFNMTTRRYQPEQIEIFAKDPNYLVAAIRVEDRFGDNGLTGVAIVRKNPQAWVIDTFLLSCRVIGRKVEETLLAYVISQAKKAGAKKVIGEFIPTKKNIPAQGLYRKNKFKLESQHSGQEKWVYSTSKKFTAPKFITVVGSVGGQ